MAIETREVEQVGDLLRDLAARDVSGLDKHQLLELTDAIATVEKLAGTLAARCAGEIARRSTPEQPGGGLARREGFGNAGAMLSKIRGGSFAGAKRSIDAGDAFTPLEVEPPQDTADASAGSADAHGADAPAPPTTRHKYPAVAQASMDGRLSVDAASIIVSGLNKVAARVPQADLDSLEARLVRRAVTMSAHDVQKMVARAVARIDRKGHEQREREIHAERYFWWKQDHEGVVTFKGQMDAVTAAPIVTVLEQMTTRDVRKQGRGEQAPEEQPDTRTVGQMRADALFELARHALGCSGTKANGVRTSIVVRMSLDDLLNGVGLGSVDGLEQPVSIAELRRLAGDAGVIPEVLGGDGEVLDLGREVRIFTRAQRIALLERDGGCAKCHAPPEHCEAHHIRWWDSGGRSDLSNGVMLCTRCHHDIHAQGWEIVAGPRRVSFIPPPRIDADRTPQPGGIDAIDLPDLSPPPEPWLELPPRDPDEQSFIDALNASDPTRLLDDPLEIDPALLDEWMAEARVVARA